MARRAWQDTIRGVTKSQLQLWWLSMHISPRGPCLYWTQQTCMHRSSSMLQPEGYFYNIASLLASLPPISPHPSKKPEGFFCNSASRITLPACQLCLEFRLKSAPCKSPWNLISAVAVSPPTRPQACSSHLCGTHVIHWMAVPSTPAVCTSHACCLADVCLSSDESRSTSSEKPASP